MEPWAPARKILASVEMPRAPARFLANGHLSLVSRQSCMSVIDKSDNEMIPGAMHRSPDIYFITEENTETLSKKTIDERFATSPRLKWDT